MQYTKKEYDILLYLRRRPRTANEIRDKLRFPSDASMNVRMSRLSPLYSVEPENANILKHEGLYTINDEGETIAQAEFDRRFDMYFTRIMSFTALLVSILALLID